MYIKPNFIFHDYHLAVKFFGLAAIIIALLCLFASKQLSSDRFFKTFYLIMMFFQGALAMICYQDKNSLIYPDEAIITHVVLFSILVLAYLKDLKPAK